MSKKRRKRKKNVVPLQKKPTWNMFIIPNRINQLWNWKTLEDVKL